MYGTGQWRVRFGDSHFGAVRVRSNAERAKLYRARAEEIRALVAEWLEPEACRQMLAAAAFYDELATELETSPDIAQALKRVARSRR